MQKACQTVFNAQWNSRTITPLDSCDKIALDAQQMTGLRDMGLVEVLKSSAVIGVKPPQLLVNGQKDDRWCLRLSADKKTLKAGPRRGLFLVVR